jgi:PTH1 family peptidyl-tRNA hydrolase
MIRLVAFLGNPGPAYAGNRHNAGRLLISSLPFGSSLSWQNKFKGLYTAVDSRRIISVLPIRTETQAGEAPAPDGGSAVPVAHNKAIDMPEKIHFLMPETYMNNSGEPVYQAASFFKLKLDEILVVHDELEIPLGFLSLKFSGGMGGHNGLRSMKACFGSADFWRLRIGIGRPNHDDISGWVLSDFFSEETERLYAVLDAGAALLLQCLSRVPETLLPEWAKKKIVDQKIVD